MKKLLQSSWLAMTLGMVLYLGTTFFMWHKADLKPAAHAEGEEDEHAELPGPASTASWDFFNPEVDMLVSELKKEKEDLALRRNQLNELAARLQSEQQELMLVTQKVAQMQKEFDTGVLRIREDEGANLKRLAKVYATMTPDGAAAVFKQMDEATMVKILTVMKDNEYAPILELMAKQGETDAKRVAAISERLRLTIPAPVKKTP